MTPINLVKNVHWLPQPNEIRTFIKNHIPQVDLVTGSFVLLFQDEKILLTKVGSRSWDIPGGHRENGETPEETAIREVLEETNVIINNLTLIGYDELHSDASKPENYPYPFPTSYMAYYMADIVEMNEFIAAHETTDISFFTVEEAQHVSWVENHLILLDYALNKHRK